MVSYCLMLVQPYCAFIVFDVGLVFVDMFVDVSLCL